VRILRLEHGARVQSSHSPILILDFGKTNKFIGIEKEFLNQAVEASGMPQASAGNDLQLNENKVKNDYHKQRLRWVATTELTR